jgi:hypothetical protein
VKILFDSLDWHLGRSHSGKETETKIALEIQEIRGEGVYLRRFPKGCPSNNNFFRIFIRS